jgi:hypothetical protein
MDQAVGLAGGGWTDGNFGASRMRPWLAAGVGLLLLAGTITGLATRPHPARSAGTAVRGKAVGGTGAGTAAGVTTSPALGAPAGANAQMFEAKSGTAAGMGASDSVGAVSAPALGAPVISPPVTSPLPPLPDLAHNQKIMKNATLSVEVKKGSFRSAFDRAASVADAHGGFVVSSDSNEDKGSLSIGSLVLRVPVKAFDAVRSELGQLGKVKNEQLSGEDVSSQLVDLDARIASLQAQEAALRALMSKATSIGDTIQIQSQLTQVRQQIEQLMGQKARLNDAADLATVRVSLAEDGAVLPQPTPKPQATFARSLKLAGHGVVLVTGGTLIVLGWLLPLAALGLLGWGAWRLFGRRTRPAAI